MRYAIPIEKLRLRALDYGGNGTMRVLAVDDQEEAIRPLKRFLEVEGFDVCIAFDGASAIRTALAFHPQVVLLDIRMSEITGIDIAKLLRQLPKFDGVTLIAITGHDDEPARQQMKDAGITYVFRKPCDYAQLATLLRKLCNLAPAARVGRSPH